MTLLNEILNYIAVDDRLVTCGQPSIEHFKLAKSEGFEVIIDLAPTDPRYSIENEVGLLSQLGLEYHHIPVAWDRPTKEDYFLFKKSMAEAKDKKLMIHCAANYRVSAFYSIYAMEEGRWDENQADKFLALVWESDPDWVLNDVWRTFIETNREKLDVREES